MKVRCFFAPFSYCFCFYKFIAVSDVGGNAKQPRLISAKVGRKLLQRLGIDVECDDVGFLVEKTVADRAANTAGGARDDRDATFETSHSPAPVLSIALMRFAHAREA